MIYVYCPLVEKLFKLLNIVVDVEFKWFNLKPEDVDILRKEVVLT